MDEFTTELPTVYGGTKLAKDGYFYNKQKDSKTGPNFKFYHCEAKFTLSCPVRIHVYEGVIVKTLHTHCHAPEPSRATALQVKDFELHTKISFDSVFETVCV